jgi:hypothetical protein
MYDSLFKEVYLKMVEQFLPNLKKAPEEMLFAETDLDHLIDLSHQARTIADMAQKPMLSAWWMRPKLRAIRSRNQSARGFRCARASTGRSARGPGCTVRSDKVRHDRRRPQRTSILYERFEAADRPTAPANSVNGA